MLLTLILVMLPHPQILVISLMKKCYHHQQPKKINGNKWQEFPFLFHPRFGVSNLQGLLRGIQRFSAVFPFRKCSRIIVVIIGFNPSLHCEYSGTTLLPKATRYVHATLQNSPLCSHFSTTVAPWVVINMFPSNILSAVSVLSTKYAGETRRDGKCSLPKTKLNQTKVKEIQYVMLQSKPSKR